MGNEIKVAIVGVGNCACTLIQGIAYCKKIGEKNVPGLLNDVIGEYKPSQLCLEKIFYHKSIRSAFTLGSVRGTALLLAAQNNLPVFEYNPTELKMALTGYGRAEKRQVQEMVKRILHISPSPSDLSEDSTDALALCICHINSSTFKFQIQEE